MSKRLEPFARLGALLYTYSAAIVMQIILLPVAAIWFVVDGILQVITGKEGLMPGGWIPTAVVDVWKWLISNNSWAFFGKGSFKWRAGIV